MPSTLEVFESATGPLNVDGTAFEGDYFDGRSAERHVVAGVLGPDGLVIEPRAPADDAPAGLDAPIVWPYPALLLLDHDADDRRIRLTARGFDGARLVLKGRNVRRWLAKKAPQIAARPPAARLLRPLGLSAAVLAAAIGLVLLAPSLSAVLAPLVPQRWAQSLGDRVVDHVAGDARVCDAAEGRAALDRLTDRLTAVGAIGQPVDVRVIDHGMINAFAAPGGRVIVLRGLIERAEGGDEVAGVLAHELGHVKHRHAMKRLIQALGIGLFARSLGGDVGALAQTAADLSFSRADERAADQEGVAMLADAGISPDGFAAFFDRLADAHGSADGTLGELAALASTHPATSERADMVRQVTARDRTFTPAMPEADWQALQAICAAEETAAKTVGGGPPED